MGSIAGLGTFGLGSNTLTVGGNNINSVAVGTIADGGSGLSVGGVLAKAGTGTLTLTGSNTYIGGTTISAGSGCEQRQQPGNGCADF